MLAAAGDLGAMDGPVRACAGGGWFCAVRQRGIRCFAAERHSSARLAGWERVGVRGKRIGMDGVSGARWVRCGGIVVPVFPFAAPGQAGFGGRTGVFGHGFAGRGGVLWLRG